MTILGESAFVSNTKDSNGKIVRGRKKNEVQDVEYFLLSLGWLRGGGVGEGARDADVQGAN